MNALVLERPTTFDRVDKVKAVVGDLVHPGDDELWILGSTLHFTVDGVDRWVPTGFTTDGASIPRLGQILTGWSRWDEPQRWAAIVHDWLYTQARVSKAYADHVLRALLVSEKATFFKTNVMYLAVRYGGGHAYRVDQDKGPMIYRDRSHDD